MKMIKQPLSLALLMCTMITLPYGVTLADDVGENEWLLPSPTIAATSADAKNVREITKVNNAVNAPVSAPVPVKVMPIQTVPAAYMPVVTPPKPVPQILEIKSQYITKDQAVKYLESKAYKLQASYAVSSGKPVNMAHLSNVLYYYLNSTTHQIGVAVSKDAAAHLTLANSEVYSARSSETLSETLARWAEKAGYQLEWMSAYNYKLQYSYEFVGNLVAADGPLNQILQSIAGNNYALKAEVTANRVILIKDNDYSPSILSR